MNFNDIGPLQVLVIGFGPDAQFEGLVLDELERLSVNGLIRVVDMRFVAKEADGSLDVMEFTELDDTEAGLFGSVIDRLLGLGAVPSDDLIVLEDDGDRSFGLGPEELASVAAELDPGDAVGVLLFEHTWASELKAAIRATGGFPIAQGFLTPEAILMVGAEVQAIVEAEAAIELADAVAGAAMLDAMAAVSAAEDIKAVAAVEAVRALMVAGLIADAAAEEAVDALIAAELVEEAAADAAAEVVAAAAQETSDALRELAAVEGSD